MTLEAYLLQHYSGETTKAYQREIEIYLSNFKDAETANYKEILYYVGLLRSRYSKASTLSRILSSIKVYYDYLCNESIRNDNPARAIKLKDRQSKDIQLQDLFTTEELEILLHRKERYQHLDYRNKVLISLFIYQGLHPQEAQFLSVENIDLKEGTIYIKATPKTNSRTLSLKPNQILLFHEYITEIRSKLLNGNASNALLVSIRGEPMNGDDITKHIKRSFNGLYAGRKITAQAIRQSVITNLLKNGNDLSIVQAFAGHKYPSATEKYKQDEVATLQAAVNKYHPYPHTP
jgi:integrase/recombinase XerD